MRSELTLVISGENDDLPNGLPNHGDAGDEHKPKVEKVNIMIREANACAQPRAVMVEIFNAVPALIAMSGR